MSEDGGRTLDAMRAQLRILMDRAEIADIMIRYSRGIRKNDSKLVASCFTQDARLESNGQKLVGAAAIETYYKEWFASTSNGGGGFGMQRIMSTPYLANDAEIRISGDTATAESSGLAVHAGKRDDTGLLVVRGAFYIDEFVRTSDGWRISKRFHGNNWVSEFPARILSSQ